MPLTPTAFAVALNRGLGRALQHLQANPDPTLRPAVLKALLHSTRFEHALEGTGTAYLLEAAELAGLQDDLRALLTGGLYALIGTGANETWDAEQQVDLLGALGERGDQDAVQVLLDLLAGAVQRDDELMVPLALALTRAQELEGLRLALQQIGQHLTVRPERWTEASLLRQAQSWLGPDLPTVVRGWATHDPAIARFLAQVEHSEAERETHPPSPPDVSYSALRTLVDGQAKRSMRLVLLGKRASDQTLLRLADDLREEQNPERLRSLLALFHHRAFPHGPAPLLALARHEEAGVARQALINLRAFAHPGVRALMLEALNQPERALDATELMERNFEPGDEVLMQDFLARAVQQESAPALHEAVRQLVRVARAHPTPGMLALVAAAYEHQPCSDCRARLVFFLEEAGALPASLREEAALDVSEELRERFAQDGG